MNWHNKTAAEERPLRLFFSYKKKIRNMTVSDFLHDEDISPPRIGADYEARTRYLHLGKVALYQMS